VTKKMLALKDQVARCLGQGEDGFPELGSVFKMNQREVLRRLKEITDQEGYDDLSSGAKAWRVITALRKKTKRARAS